MYVCLGREGGGGDVMALHHIFMTVSLLLSSDLDLRVCFQKLDGVLNSSYF